MTRLIAAVLALVCFAASPAFALNVKGNYNGVLTLKKVTSTGGVNCNPTYPYDNLALNGVYASGNTVFGSWTTFDGIRSVSGTKTAKGFKIVVNWTDSYGWERVTTLTATKITKSGATISELDYLYWPGSDYSCRRIYKGPVKRVR